VTNGARLLRGPLRSLLRCLLPVLAASAALAAAALPATAAVGAATVRSATVTVRSAAAGSQSSAAPWWLTALHLPAALRGARAAGGGVTVAVLSTGVDASHRDLAGTVITGPDFSKTGRKQGGEYWGEEGTAVASLIAGHGHGTSSAKGATGDAGITGVAPGARILSIQVTLEYDDPLNADAAAGRRLPGAIAAGIRYAVAHGATVIALPLDPGTLGPSDTGDPAAAGGSAAERSAVSYALARNVVLVAPAGDNGAGTNAVNYPAAYRGVIAVGATGRNGQLAPFTGAHSYVALTAPGSGVTPAVPVPGGMETDPAAGLMVADSDGQYQSLASTDMSAALTAGVAALIRSRYPRLTVPEVTQALEPGAAAQASQASRAAADGGGHGELNATAALTAAAAIAADHPAPAPSPSPSHTASPSPARSPAAGAAAAPTPRPGDPGHLLRSLVVGLVVAAGVLIACLIGAVTLTRVRRRVRAAGSGTAGSGASVPVRSSSGTRLARHARGRPAPAVPERRDFWADGVDLHHQQAGLSGTPEATAGLSGVIWPTGPAQRQRPDEEPPWPPASPPGSRLSPEAFLSAEPEVQPGESLAPWEQSPADFAVAPADDRAPWPVSNTGPMYVWNPAATTGPLSIVEGVVEGDDKDSAG
jgi:serine protease